jgi:hypothetical protein
MEGGFGELGKRGSLNWKWIDGTVVWCMVYSIYESYF